MYIEIGFMEKRRDAVLKDLATLLSHVDGYDWERRNTQQAVENLLREALNFCRTLNEEIDTLQESRDGLEMECARLERRCEEIAQRQ